MKTGAAGKRTLSKRKKLPVNVEGECFTSGKADPNCEYIDCTFELCILGEASNSRFVKCNFQGCQSFGEGVLSGTEFLECAFGNMQFGSQSVTSAMDERTSNVRQLQNIKFKKCTFKSSSFIGVETEKCSFTDSKFPPPGFGNFGTSFRGAKFTGCDFSNVDLSRVFVGPGTEFKHCDCNNAKFTRIQIATMSDSGITTGQRIGMRIQDDAAVLHRQYAGFQQWLHLIFLAIFIAPYAFFALSKIVPTLLPFQAKGEKEAMGLQIVRFIWNAGEHLEVWRLNIFMFCIFIFGLAYNALRLLFLRKSMELRLEEDIKGTPPNFSLDDVAVRHTRLTWRRLSFFSQIGFYIGILLVVFHTCHFLSMAVPK